ncbi:MAG: glyoxylate/hydroxypyruvate reductase A [Roseibium sp.]
MKPVIPFVSDASGTERQIWRTALPEALEDIADVKVFEDLTPEERDAATVAIVANPDPAKVAALKNLVWVQSLWAGVERLVAELPETGPLIVQLNDPQLADTMAEAVLAWTLYLHRDMPRYMQQQRQKVWADHQLILPEDRTIGVLGIGNLGAKSAQRLKANGFNVIGWSRSAKSIDGIETCCGPDGLKSVLTQSDILVVLMPLTTETHGMLDADALNSCKAGGSLINFARGPVLVTPALLSALDSGHLSHAVLDVFDQEPLPDDHPFWTHEKITILPHISAPTITSTASKIVADNIGRYLATGEVPECVDRTRGY